MKLTLTVEADPSFTIGCVTAPTIEPGPTLITPSVAEDDPEAPLEPVTETVTVNTPARPNLWLGPLQVVPVTVPATVADPSP